MGNSLSEFPGDELDELERKKLRRLLQQDDRAHWLWSHLAKWIIAAAAIGSAVATIKTVLSGYIQWKP